MAFGRLSSDNELTAMRAAGYGLKRITFVTMVFAAAISALALLVGFQFAPWGEYTMTRTLYEAGSVRPASPLQSSSFSRDFFDMIIYAENVDAGSGQLKHVFIVDERQTESPLVIVAPRGAVQSQLVGKSGARQAVLMLFRGSIYNMNRASTSSEKVNFDKYAVVLKADVSEVYMPDLPRMADLSGILKKIKTRIP